MTEEIVAFVMDDVLDNCRHVLVHWATQAPKKRESLYKGLPLKKKQLVAFARICGAAAIVDLRGTPEGLYETYYDWNRRIK